MRIEHTVHEELKVKYEKLLAFAKRISDNGDICCQKCIEDMAVELLEEIGESK